MAVCQGAQVGGFSWDRKNVAPSQSRGPRLWTVEQILSVWERKVGWVRLELLPELLLLLMVLKVGRGRRARSRCRRARSGRRCRSERARCKSKRAGTRCKTRS